MQIIPVYRRWKLSIPPAIHIGMHMERWHSPNAYWMVDVWNLNFGFCSSHYFADIGLACVARFSWLAVTSVAAAVSFSIQYFFLVGYFVFSRKLKFDNSTMSLSNSATIYLVIGIIRFSPSTSPSSSGAMSLCTASTHQHITLAPIRRNGACDVSERTRARTHTSKPRMSKCDRVLFTCSVYWYLFRMLWGERAPSKTL